MGRVGRTWRKGHRRVTAQAATRWETAVHGNRRNSWRRCLWARAAPAPQRGMMQLLLLLVVDGKHERRAGEV